MVKRCKNSFGTVLAGVAMALVLLLASALPALAASEQVENVQNQLAHLQRVQISPEWLPDIRANQSAVQALLDGYMALSLPQRQELTPQNRTDLRSYFEALYQVLGKDVEGVDALFEEATAAPGASSSRSSANASSASSGAGSRSSAAGGAVSSGAVSSAASSAVSSASGTAGASGVASSPAPAPVVPSASGDESGKDASRGMPAAVNPPQTPKGDGWLALFGNRTLGAAMLMLLAVLAVLLVVRFLLALRRAESEGRPQAEVDLRAQEMFGETYDPVEDPVNDSFLPKLPPAFLDSPPAALPQHTDIFDEEATGASEGFAMFGPANDPNAAKKEGFFARRRKKEEKAQADETAEPWPDAGTAQQAAEPPPNKTAARAMAEPMPQKPPGQEAAPSKASAFEPPNPAPSRFDKVFDLESLPPPPKPPQTPLARPGQGDAAAPPPRAEAPASAPPPFGANPDKRNSITTRSFSPAPRTGRPGKMPFRQGDPDDLDAIDE